MFLKKVNPKILCYVIIFDQVDIIEKSLDFLTRNTDKLDIVVIENPSSNTPSLRKIIQRYGKEKLIKRHYTFNKNITGEAFKVVLGHEQRELKQRQYVMVTDGDLTSEDGSVFDEQRTILENNPDVFACGVTLDKKNLPIKSFPEAKDWIPADYSTYPDYYEVRTGAHLLLFRSKELLRCLHWLNKTKLSFVDANLHKYCYEVAHKQWSRTKRSQAYHLTWDLYGDINHPYTKLKTSKNFDETWQHQKTATFSIENFAG